MLRLIKSYLFWTYQRGTFHYDVMVTAILIFMFLTPHFIDFLAIFHIEQKCTKLELRIQFSQCFRITNG